MLWQSGGVDGVEMFKANLQPCGWNNKKHSKNCLCSSVYVYFGFPVILTYRVMRQLLTRLLNRQRVKILLDQSMYWVYLLKWFVVRQWANLQRRKLWQTRVSFPSSTDVSWPAFGGGWSYRHQKGRRHILHLALPVQNLTLIVRATAAMCPHTKKKVKKWTGGAACLRHDSKPAYMYNFCLMWRISSIDHCWTVACDQYFVGRA